MNIKLIEITIKNNNNKIFCTSLNSNTLHGLFAQVFPFISCVFIFGQGRSCGWA